VKKLQLDPDTLMVQSFDTAPHLPEGGGTVFGRATLQYDASCGATYCGDCNATDPDVDCGGGESGACPSVNVANCESAFYSDCCGGGTVSFCRYSADFYNPAGIGCT
jgi:hypothetical protein